MEGFRTLNRRGEEDMGRGCWGKGILGAGGGEGGEGGTDILNNSKVILGRRGVFGDLKDGWVGRGGAKNEEDRICGVFGAE